MKSILVLLIPAFLCLAPLSGQITLNPNPTRVVGQNSVQPESISPNLVEGREFFAPSALALDTSTNPPALYVSDTVNNRVLAFHSAVAFANGQKADLVMGQIDFASTFGRGPGTSLTTGLSSPSGLAVDAAGNLYVVDSGNNRILRFPKPFAQAAQPPLPDIAIGQTSFSTGSANQGAAAASASSLAFSLPATSGTAASIFSAFIAVDPQGDLWVADAANNRVLRFNASVLGSQAASGPAADIVLGQPDFVSNGYNPPATSNPLTSLTTFTTPTGIAFDAAGRLFVGESISTRRGRILMYTPQFFVGQAAARILGVDGNNPPVTSEFQFSISPGGIFPVGNGIGVADTQDSRILIFPAVEQWTPNTTYQAAIEVAGQTDFTSSQSNQGLATATASTLSGPGTAAFYGNELYVVDTSNNRVVVMPQNGASFGPATRVLGQDAMNLNSPNLVEGRELNITGTGSGAGGGMAVDLSSNPPHLYIADTFNNRVLGYKDLRNIQPGQKADIVIGQPNFQQALANYPNNSSVTNASGLASPVGLVVDPQGNLYVADAGNSRVLRFPAPFANYVPGVMEAADLLLGQQSFTATKVTDALPQTMATPYGLALTTDPGLLVSDVSLNRVLFFRGASSDFRSGMAAATVFGQPNFNSGGSGSGLGQLSSPHHISVDLEDRLYVTDTGNGRVSIWATVPSDPSGQPAAQTLSSGLRAPVGMYVSPTTNDIWVGDANGAAVRFSPYNQLETNNFAPNATIPDVYSPRAVVQDAWGDLFVADAANRVVIYYPGLAPLNGASFLYPNLLAPGMIASLFSLGNTNQFGGQATSAPAGQFPLPAQLNDVQVVFNGAPVPLFYADPNQINFFVPMGAPQSGLFDLQVQQNSTGRILGDTTVQMNVALPGLFSETGNGIGTVAAINQDNTINSPTNPAIAGQVITLFGTGQGFIGGQPADGYGATAGQTATPPVVYIGGFPVDPSAVKYAGTAPGLVGVWQINVVIPPGTITLPTSPTYVFVQQSSFISGVPANGRAIQIYVKAK
ncbi:MAG TPA: hypothetical protein VG273_01075 [Bryobacteraceae bacterium]|jgi:uncharacterized protein (TIGR03437 family)|nr:hypothetical protein [Bryobacteraceae bacterium]